MQRMQDVLLAKHKIKKILQNLEGISGIGVSWDDEGEPCVRVNVNYSLSQADREKIPQRIGEIPVQVQLISELQLEESSG